MNKTYTATIYHNPKCGTSRNVLKVLQDASYDVTIIDYLSKGWNLDELKSLLQEAGLTAKMALRINKTPAVELGLTEEGVTEEDILIAMLENPILVNRPIVKTNLGVKMCRPSEEVLSILEVWPAGPYFKEDGELMIDKDGNKK
ncbi:arsenate reductase family protein [Thorsellia kenyensis]|uniref:Arsenate reductase n=1 Tax=Thorsellia kenyensis TaxID=1549888 RepID=A0ABV6C6L6_9GAMM